MKSSGNDSITLWSQGCLWAMTLLFVLSVVIGSFIKKDHHATIFSGITLTATILVVYVPKTKWFNNK